MHSSMMIGILSQNHRNGKEIVRQNKKSSITQKKCENHYKEEIFQGIVQLQKKHLVHASRV